MGTTIKPEAVYTVRAADDEDGVGTRTSFLLHLNSLWKDFVSIHFREFQPEKDRVRVFLSALQADLDQLAAIAQQHIPKSAQVIVGLSQVSAAWGRKHGWSTITYSEDPKLIVPHLKSLHLPIPETLPRLTLFLFPKEGFIRQYLGKSGVAPSTA